MTELAAGVRFVHLAALCLLFGSYAFVAWIARPAWLPAARAAESSVAREFERFVWLWHRRFVWCALPVVLATALMSFVLQMLALQASSGAGVAELLTQTRYGHVWLARLALMLGLGILLLVTRSSPNTRVQWQLGLSGALAAALALSGHASAGEGWELVLQLFADALHVLAAAAWLGSLLPLCFALRFAVVTPGASGITATCVALYSRLGIVCVTLLVVTGLVNAWQLVEGIPNLLGTAYGRMLLVKLSIVMLLLAIAWVNLRRLNPAIRSAGASFEAGAAHPGPTLALARNVAIEMALGLAILLVVAFLGVTPPARHAQPEWPLSFRWDWSVLDASAKARGEFEVAMMWLLFGALALELAWLVKKARLPAAIAGIALSAWGLHAALSVVNTDAYPSTFRRPAVAYQAISVAHGAAIYEKHCASCHGNHGRGDGPAAENLTPRPADLTGAHVNAHTAGDLFWWVSHGKAGGAMRGFADVLGEEERWDAVNFVRALAGARKSRSLAPVIDDKTLIAAPDFSYVDSSGAARALKDARGEKVVLLVLLGGAQSSNLAARLRASSTVLTQAGLVIIVVPRATNTAAGGGTLTWAVEGNAEIHATYALFTQNFSDDAAHGGTRHSEFLIDKQGYIRARWLAHENEAWRDPSALLKQAVLLRDEPPRAPMPQEHVH